MRAGIVGPLRIGARYKGFDLTDDAFSALEYVRERCVQIGASYIMLLGDVFDDARAAVRHASRLGAFVHACKLEAISTVVVHGERDDPKFLRVLSLVTWGPTIVDGVLLAHTPGRVAFKLGRDVGPSRGWRAGRGPVIVGHDSRGWARADGRLVSLGRPYICDHRQRSAKFALALDGEVVLEDIPSRKWIRLTRDCRLRVPPRLPRAKDIGDAVVEVTLIVRPGEPRDFFWYGQKLGKMPCKYGIVDVRNSFRRWTIANDIEEAVRQAAARIDASESAVVRAMSAVKVGDGSVVSALGSLDSARPALLDRLEVLRESLSVEQEKDGLACAADRPTEELQGEFDGVRRSLRRLNQRLGRLVDASPELAKQAANGLAARRAERESAEQEVAQATERAERSEDAYRKVAGLLGGDPEDRDPSLLAERNALFLKVIEAREELGAAQVALDGVEPTPDWTKEEQDLVLRMTTLRENIAAVSRQQWELSGILERRKSIEALASEILRVEDELASVAGARDVLGLTTPPELRIGLQRVETMKRAGLRWDVAWVVAGHADGRLALNELEPLDLDKLPAELAKATAEFLADGPAWARSVPVKTEDEFLKAILSVRDAE